VYALQGSSGSLILASVEYCSQFQPLTIRQFRRVAIRDVKGACPAFRACLSLSLALSLSLSLLLEGETCSRCRESEGGACYGFIKAQPRSSQMRNQHRAPWRVGFIGLGNDICMRSLCSGGVEPMCSVPTRRRDVYN
jgi:hypothetical protein